MTGLTAPMPSSAVPFASEEAIRLLRDWFEDYAARQLADDAPLPLRMKLEHSRRVAGICRLLAVRSNWSEEDTAWAEIIGLLHDVGRFSQYRAYRTFRDSRSLDHGLHGSEVASSAAPVRALADDWRDCVLLAIRHHNAHHPPDDLPARVRPFVDIVRDADKLDIYRVIAETLRDRTYEKHPELLLDIDVQGGLSPEVVAECLRGAVAPYRSIRSLLDVRLLQSSWVYDLNLRAAHALLLERDILEEIRTDLPDTDEVRRILHRAENHARACVAGEGR